MTISCQFGRTCVSVSQLLFSGHVLMDCDVTDCTHVHTHGKRLCSYAINWDLLPKSFRAQTNNDSMGVIRLYENMAGVSKNTHADSHPVGGGSTKARVRRANRCFFRGRCSPPHNYTRKQNSRKFFHIQFFLAKFG